MTRVAVIGAGKMGLPLACQFASRGALVTACDTNDEVVRSVNEGVCPFDEPEVPQLLQQLVREKQLSATSNTVEAVRNSDAVIVIVPVLLTDDKRADLSIISSVTAQIARGLQPGTLVSYETTLPVGATRNLIGILNQSGLEAGKDFHLAFSPERVKSRHVMQRLSENAKVVGGVNEDSARKAADFYAEFLGAPIINVGTLEAAELVKLAGMVYRDVNIALSNEIARYAGELGLDIEAVLKAANTDGEAAMLLPGIGVGGHCTPVYPYFLTHEAAQTGTPVRLAEVSREVNDEQPAYMIDLLERKWQPLASRHVTILGLGFRPDVKEAICSPAFLLKKALEATNARVSLWDPLYTQEEIESYGFEFRSLADSGAAPDVVILNTAHSAFYSLPFDELARKGLKAVVDGRNVWDPETIGRLNIFYLGVGRAPSDWREAAAERARTAQSDHARADAQSDAAHAEPIPIAKPVLGKEEVAAASRAIKSGWVMQGPEVEMLEQEFAQFVHARHACAVSSGTAALHLALLAAGVGAGDEVITVSHSFVATANSVRYCGAVPVFVDIDHATFNIDPSKIAAAIGKRTRAILCVHQMGMPCDLSTITSIAREHKLIVIEDAACAAGSEILWDGTWERIGKPHGDIACFSFHPRKLITTGDGGMLTTSNAAWDRQFRLLRNHGINADGTHEVLGYNYRMTDIQAAVGREQLRRLPGMVAERREMARAYFRCLSAAVDGLGIPVEPSWARSNWQSICVRLPRGVDQRLVLSEMKKNGVTCKTGITCSHREPAYAREPWSCKTGRDRCECRPDSGKTGHVVTKHASISCHLLKESEAAQNDCVILPLFAGLGQRGVARIAELFGQCIKVARVD